MYIICKKKKQEKLNRYNNNYVGRWGRQEGLVGIKSQRSVRDDEINFRKWGVWKWTEKMSQERKKKRLGKDIHTEKITECLLMAVIF